MAYRGMEYLRKLLELKRSRVLLRYRYYEAKNGVNYLKTVIPQEMMWMASCLGWCGKAVDSLADRLNFREFRNDNFGLNEIYQMNNMDILPDSAMLSGLIASCCFVYISEDITGYPRMQVIDGANGTGVIDPITGMLEEGYAVLKRNDGGRAELEAYFVAGKTEYWQDGRKIREDTNRAPYALLVPIIHRPDAVRAFGRSRISRSCMGLMQGALRTLLRSEVSAEFYAFPQKWMIGLSAETVDTLTADKWRATIASIIALSTDEDGKDPKLGQFDQTNMQPFTDQMRMFAALFAGETGMTVDDLGFVSDNPASADAIMASHENLRLRAKKAQKTFGTGFLNAGYLAACVRDNFQYRRDQLYQTKLAWEPVFAADAQTLAGIGDAAQKINMVIPGYFGKQNLQDITGIEPED